MTSPSMERISASAGSGKTHALTLKVLDILESGLQHGRPDSWKNIMAITFTNAAAAEMRERILEGVRERALDDQNPYSDRWSKLYEDILRHLQLFNVRTIDSLLYTIVRMSALDLHISPASQLEFDPFRTLHPYLDRLFAISSALSTDQQKDLIQLLDQACRQMVLDSNTVPFFTSHQNRLRQAIANLYPLMASGEEESLFEHCRHTFESIPPKCRHLKKLIRHLLSGIETEKFDVKKAAANAFDTLEKALDTEYPAAFPQSICFSYKSLSQCLKKSSRPVSQQLETQYESVKTAFAELRRLCGFQSLWPYMQVAHAVMNGYREELLSRGIIPSQILPACAARVVKEFGPSEALMRLNASFQQTLIDEFQDTSREQWESIEDLVVDSLSQGGSFIYVGDPKQAIYGWRGGDANLIRDLENPYRHPLANIAHFRSQALGTNYRSRKYVVDFNNGFFGQFREKKVCQSFLENALTKNSVIPEDEVEDLRQTFADVVQQAQKTDGGYVRLLRLPNEAPAETDASDSPDDGESVDAQLLSFVCWLLKREDDHAGRTSDPDFDLSVWNERWTKLQTEKIINRYSYRDIAILVRNNTQAEKTARALADFGIPFITSESSYIKNHRDVIELVDFLRFLNDPRQDIAFWTVLHSRMLKPFLPQRRFDNWLYYRCGKSQTGRNAIPLYLLFRKSYPKTWEKCFAPVDHQAGLLTAYDTARELIRILSLFERFPESRPFLEGFLEILFSLEQKGQDTIAKVLDIWDSENNTYRIQLSETINAVRIMTIHSAKGLQFPVVIIPWNNMQGGSHAGELQICLPCSKDGREGSMLSVPALLSKENTPEAYQRKKIRELRESLNLLYVAWTRPEDELYILLPPVSPSGKNNFIKALNELLTKNGIEDSAQLGERRKTQDSARIWKFIDLCRNRLTGVSPKDIAEAVEKARCTFPYPISEDWIEKTKKTLKQESRLREIRCPLPNNESGSAQRSMFIERCCSRLVGTSARDIADVIQKTQYDFPQIDSESIKQAERALQRYVDFQNPSGPLMKWLPDRNVFSNPFHRTDSVSAQRGEFIHLCCSRLAGTSAGDIADAVEAGRCDFPLQILPEWLEEAQSVLTWYASLPETANVIHFGSPEQTLINERGERLRPDRIVRMNGKIIVIDYKTGMPRASHHTQITAYMRLLHRIDPESLIAGSLVYLDRRTVVPVAPPS
ncbi:MAG: UvrD-helicase domain-containing protein [Desulfovibrionaceae bacterium]|nr:UvrD-helicase domain-containing protein [Desulfovibrionaceae bacterium]